MSRQTNQFDFLVIGGGIVGLATAWKLACEYSDCSICVLEKEDKLAAHQSGRNSGVLHSGIYYKPGSLKATTCRAGKAAMEQFCEEHNVAYELCGKVIVAVDDEEVPRLARILERGEQNGVHCERIDRPQLLELEPHCQGVQAIHVPESGIVNYPAVCNKLAELLRARGHVVELNREVRTIQHLTNSIRVSDGTENWTSSILVGCAGLHSDRLAKLAGLAPPAKIVPFRGEYYELTPQSRELCRNLIYPVPDPNFPFLGVHFTRMVSGDVECGPNAVFALSREGYSWSQIGVRDLAESVTYGGFIKLATAHWKMGLGEIHRSLSKSAFVKALQRLIPEIRSKHLKPCRAGVRAQAISPDGAMVDDFLWVDGKRMVHVCNAPSPAATASLEIGRHIVDRVKKIAEAN